MTSANIDTKHRQMQRNTLARQGETFAAHYLEKRGYQVLARNYRAGNLGEIDLIVLSPKFILVFIEVKTRKFPHNITVCAFEHTGQLSLTPRKLKNMQKSAFHYLNKSQINKPYFKGIAFEALLVKKCQDGEIPESSFHVEAHISDIMDSLF